MFLLEIFSRSNTAETNFSIYLVLILDSDCWNQEKLKEIQSDRA